MYSPRPHGNKKNEGGERDYRRTLPSVINQLKTGIVVGEKTPSKVYFDMVTGKASGPYQGVTNARNLNQVKMTAKHMKAKRRIFNFTRSAVQFPSTGISNRWLCSWHYRLSRLGNCIWINGNYSGSKQTAEGQIRRARPHVL